MVTVREVSAEKFNKKLVEELKKINEIAPPAWASFVKSGAHRERVPSQKDFWYVRTASVLRRIYLDGPVGVSRLRAYFGGRRRRGHKPARFRRASGSILRKILQQLEKTNLIEKVKEGRKITVKGQKFLDNIAHGVQKNE